MSCMMSYGSPQGKFAKRQGIEKDKYQAEGERLCYFCGDPLVELGGAWICETCDIEERGDR